PIAEGDIPEGKRNDELFTIACKLVTAGIPPGSVERALQAENATRCKPPLAAEEVRGIAESACEQAQKKPKAETHSETLLRLVDGVAFWWGDDDKGYATVARAGHREHYPIRGQTSREWLAGAALQA